MSYCVYLEYGYEKNTNRSILLHILTSILAIKYLEIFIGTITQSIGLLPVFSSTPLEAFTVILIENRFTSKIWYLVSSLPIFLSLIIIVASAIMSYTILGFLIFFPDSSEQEEYFNTYGNALWTMLMVLNESYWPAPMLPAYNFNRFYFIYFFFYIVVFGWGLLNVVLGFIYILFQRQKSDITNKLLNIKLTNIKRAFDVIDQFKSGYLMFDQVTIVVHIMLSNYENVRPTEVEVNELVANLNQTSIDPTKIYFKDFINILETCSAHCLRILRSKTYFERYFNQSKDFNFNTNIMNIFSNNRATSRDSFNWSVNSESLQQSLMLEYKVQDYNRSRLESSASVQENKIQLSSKEFQTFVNPSRITCSMQLKSIIESIYYDVILDTIIFILSLLFVLGYVYIELLLTIFMLMVFESLSKLIVKGFYRFKKLYRNSFDALMTIAVFITLIITLLFSSVGNPANDASIPKPLSYELEDFGLRVLFFIRIILFPRNIFVSRRLTSFRQKYRKAFEHSLLVGNHFLFLIIVLLVFIYVYAAIGVYAFGGKINLQTDDNSLKNSLYGQEGYWPLNFNDIPSGMVTMFVLLHVNNMHITTSGFVATTSNAAEIFFGSWYIFGVVFLLNILIAFLLNEFLVYLQKTMKSPTTLPEDNSTPAPTIRPLISVPSDDNMFLATDQSHLANSILLKNNVLIPTTPKDRIKRRAMTSIQSIQDIQSALIAGSNSDFDSSNLSGNMNVNNDLSMNETSNLSVSTFISSISPRPTVPPTVPKSNVEIKDFLESSSKFSISPFANTEKRKMLQSQMESAYKTSKYGKPKSKFSSNDDETATVQSHSNFLYSGYDDSMQLSMSRTFNFPTLRNSDTATIENTLLQVSLLKPSEVDNVTTGNTTENEINMASINKIQPFELAAIYIQIAREGHNSIGHTSPDSMDKAALYCFRFWNKYNTIVRLSAWLLTICCFFERPYWTYNESSSDWYNSSIYPVFGVNYLSPLQTVAFKVPLLMIELIGLFIELGYLTEFSLIDGRNYFFSRRSARFLLILSTCVQIMFLFILLVNSSSDTVIPKILVIFSYLNILYMLWFYRRSMIRIRMFIKLIPHLIPIVCLLALLIMFFAVFGKPL